MHSAGLFTSGKARTRSTLSLAIALIIIAGGAAVQRASAQQSAKTAAEPRLRERMSAYWSAMERGDFEAAASYIHPASRSIFTHEVRKDRLLKWRIDKLSFNADGTSCDTVTIVTKPLPYGAPTIDWTVSNTWVLVDGEWYFKLPWEKGQNPFLDLFRGVGGATSVRASSDEAPAPPEVRTAPSVRIFPDPANPGRVHAGEKRVFRFHYPNGGVAPMRIVAAHADCHCTGVAKEYPEIAPGETGVLEVTLDTFGLPLGRLDKDITVEFSDSAVLVTARIAVENLPNFRITPAFVDFGILARGTAADSTVRIANESGRAVEFRRPPTTDPALGVALDRTVVGPGEILTVRLRYAPSRPGEFMDNLIFQTDLGAEPIFTVRVLGRVE
jgi:hypothetical protein